MTEGPTREQLIARLELATRLIENFEDWSANFAEGYLDVTYGGTLAEDIGYQRMYLEACNFLDIAPTLDVDVAMKAWLEEVGEQVAVG